MPVPVSYPGVYVEEIPSGVRSITGVATSIAAFAGWAPQGPVDRAQLILSWADYNRQFGGLDARSVLGYSVSQFFANGGQQAYIIRLVSGAKPGAVTIGPLTLTAQNPGTWAANYGIAIKGQTGSTTRFQLRVVYAPPGATSEVTVESFDNVSIITPDPQGRFVADVINSESSYITASVTAGASAAPANTTLPSPTLKTGSDDGTVLVPNSAGFETALNIGGSTQSGIVLLDHVDLFNILCVPGETSNPIQTSLEQYCQSRRAFLIADPDSTITDYTKLTTGPQIAGNNAAFYFPWIEAPDPLNQNRLRSYPPCGFVAGIYARIDASRGVWKAPAGTEATLIGVSGVSVALNDQENGILNPVAVNCIRNFSVYGTVVWGARTVEGNDEIGSDWKYIPVRRLALYLEESLFRSLKWVVFEPNDEPLWAQIRLDVGSFMQTLFRQGAFQGSTPQQAYFVKCDSETTTAADQNNGIVNILVGFAPLKPAEFVVIQIQQMAGQTAS
ncbi:Phage tail sheath protein [Candidatus Sulfopaludibacter sp. SbA3]|nr:Phage tail sheath protein [Candidatus Sulfopaludibacter sp. SbA3]